jgi:2-phospho-L-lactate guanylyltransferase (CobY/MobA/RfbA family)
LLQKNKGLNLGLEWTAQQLPKRRTAFISADLPNLAQLDVALLVTEPEVGISPDKSRRGTNAITVPGPLVMGFCYGNGSFDAHCELARATAFKLKVIDSHGLSFDLDTETDLSLFKGWSGAINPRRVLL